MEVDMAVPSSRSLTPSSAAAENSRLARADLHADRRRLRAWPQAVYMDISNRCNLACVICPYHWNGRDMRKAEVMPKEVFYRVGRELFAHASTVYLFGGGEVFLHPDWDEMFDFARRWSFLPVLSTNGTPLNDRRIAALVEAGTHLRISFDGACRETFERIRCGARFDQVIANIRKLVRRREQHPAERFCLRFSVTAFDANIREAPRLVELAADLGVEQVVFHHLMVDRNPLAGHELRHFPELSDEMLIRAAQRGAELGVHVQVPSPFRPHSDAARRLAEVAPRIPPNRLAAYFAYPQGPAASYTCRIPWVETWVKPDGRVAPCCMIARELTLGDVSSRPFRAIWNGRPYRRFRGRVNSAQPPPTCTSTACVFRQHQHEEGRLRVGDDGAVELDSRCPGRLRARLHARSLEFRGPRLRAALEISNRGDTRWLADAPGAPELGRVRLGLKLLGQDGRLLEQDFLRIPLTRDVRPRESISLDVDTELPPHAAAFHLDLVAEGVSWFEDDGSRPLILRPSGTGT